MPEVINYSMVFFLLLLGEMGHQYINTDERTTTNFFKFQKIYIFSNKYVKWGMGGGHMQKIEKPS